MRGLWSRPGNRLGKLPLIRCTERGSRHRPRPAWLAAVTNSASSPPALPPRTAVADPAAVAASLHAARRSGRTLAPITDARPLDLAEAYRIQDELTALRLAAGERRVGWKLGYTSAAMRAQMGVAAPNYGPLTDAMLLADGATVPAAALQPRVEPEVAVIIGPGARRLVELAEAAARGEDFAPEDVLPAVQAVRAALEVVDSIWAGYRFRLEDNTADGSSAAWVVLGAELPVEQLDAVRVTLVQDDRTPLDGAGRDADGHPLRGLVWLAAQLSARGLTLCPGDLVITGGLTRAVPLDRTVTAHFAPASGAPVTLRVHPPTA